jgi:hypothetical protein
MITDIQIRNQLIRRIQQIPSNKLRELNEFIEKLELTTSYKEKNLSYAGAWADIDSEIFDILTKDLQDNRQRNKTTL